MKASLTTAIAGSVWLLFAAAGDAATFSALNSTTVKFNAGTSEANLIDLGAAKVSFGNTTVYIGTNQVSSNNQDPIVTSFTNGLRDWVSSYDSSGIDGRGVGLLWDEASSNLYGVFTADGGSNGANSFGSTAQGWLGSYGRGGGAKASVLLKLNPDSGEAEAGTYLRSQLPNGNTNTVAPTDLDFVDGEVVFYGDAFFTPLDTDKQPFTEKTSDDGSPFAYRVVLSADLATATQAEAIGWNGVEQFSPLGSGTGEPGGEEPGGEEPGGEEPGGEEPGGEEPGGEEPGGEEPGGEEPGGEEPGGEEPGGEEPGGEEPGGEEPGGEEPGGEEPVGEEPGGEEPGGEEPVGEEPGGEEPGGEEPGGEEPGGEEPVGEEPGGEEPGGEEPGGEEPGGEEPDVASVPEPGFVIGLGALAATSLSMRRRRRSPSQSA